MLRKLRRSEDTLKKTRNKALIFKSKGKQRLVRTYLFLALFQPSILLLHMLEL